jgi:hypothetical protein
MADADGLYHKAAVLGDTIKGTLRVIVMDMKVSDLCPHSITSSCVRHVVVIDLGKLF